MVVECESVEFRLRCLAFRLDASAAEFDGGGIITGSSGMFFTLLSTADNGSGEVGGGGAISCGGGRRMRLSPSRVGIQPSGGMSTAG